jgi:hypothetical protein
MASDKFGLDTWVTMTAFIENIRNVISTMRLYYDLINKLDQEFLSRVLPDQQMLLRIKQHIVLDLILKAEIIVESSLIFIYQLSNGYPELSKIMSRYSNEFVKEVVIKVWEKDFSLLRALGAPSAAGLHLEEHKQDLLISLYQQTESNAWVQLGKLADFDKFRTVYHKYKHGLILRTGSSIRNNGNSNSALTLEKSSLEALDRKSADDLPKDCIKVDKDDNLAPWMFNAISHVNLSQKLIEEIFTIVSIAEQLVSYVCANHQIYAINCGQSYLPFAWIDGKLTLTFLLPESALSGNERVLESDANTIVQEMNVQNVETHENFAYKNASFVEAIQNNTVTNIFERSKP